MGYVLHLGESPENEQFRQVLKTEWDFVSEFINEFDNPTLYYTDSVNIFVSPFGESVRVWIKSMMTEVYTTSVEQTRFLKRLVETCSFSFAVAVLFIFQGIVDSIQDGHDKICLDWIDLDRIIGMRKGAKANSFWWYFLIYLRIKYKLLILNG
jgi:hypothetical protein